MINDKMSLSLSKEEGIMGVSEYIKEEKEKNNLNVEEMTNIEKIKYLIKKNNGYITTNEISRHNIARDYISKLILLGQIERVARGIYIDSSIFEDEFYTFQLKYPKTIFSHFTSLYFHNLTEVLPYNYDISVINNVYKPEFKKHNVFYIKKEWEEIGITEVTDNYGFRLKVYDVERSICDIIRSKERLDIEQVKKSVREYVKSEKRDIFKLQKYAKQMNIQTQVMEFVGMYYE